MKAAKAAVSALDALKQSAGSAASQLLEATLIDNIWGIVQSRISAHFIDHYQESVREKCQDTSSGS